MATTAQKVTVFFESASGIAPTGWTETFWSGVVDQTVLATSVMNNYVPARAQLLGLGASIQAVRVGNDPPNRITEIQFTSGNQGQPTYFTKKLIDNYDPTQADLLCRIKCLGGHRRQFWIGGVPDSVTSTGFDGGYNPAFVNNGLLANLQNIMKTLNFAVRYKTSSGPPATYALDPISEIKPETMRNRKRGRPFFLFRGRRQA